jgi:hypothetical protein
VSDLGRGLFSFEFPAQIETSASRETALGLFEKLLIDNLFLLAMVTLVKK